jgi:hypothetical protein
MLEQALTALKHLMSVQDTLQASHIAVHTWSTLHTVPSTCLVPTTDRCASLHTTLPLGPHPLLLHLFQHANPPPPPPPTHCDNTHLDEWANHSALQSCCCCCLQTPTCCHTQHPIPTTSTLRPSHSQPPQLDNPPLTHPPPPTHTHTLMSGLIIAHSSAAAAAAAVSTSMHAATPNIHSQLPQP